MNMKHHSIYRLAGVFALVALAVAAFVSPDFLGSPDGVLLSMTTLAANAPRAFEIGSRNAIPVIASDIIYEGAAVGIVVQDVAELFFHRVDELLALGLDEDLDARLVEVVAAAVAVVDA